MAWIVDEQSSKFKHFCKICNKGFMCVRALGGHMRTHGIGDELDDEEPVSDWEDKYDAEINPTGNKRMYALRTNPNRCKRTMRFKVDAVCPSSEDEDLANCLMMLSNSNIPIESEESCASASRDEERGKTINFMSPLVCNNSKFRGLFECKACKKVFNSHQALGGHRASHKKVKGCFAAKQDQVGEEYVPDDDDVITQEDYVPAPNNRRRPFEHGSSYSSPSTAKRKSKVHECSICHRVFSSGQALGGHKRCHWITSNSPDTAAIVKLQQFHNQLEQIRSDPLALKLDMNLAASAQYELTRSQRDMVISSTPLQTGFEFSTEMYLKSWLGIDTKEREVHNHQHYKQRQQIHEKNNIYIEKNNQSDDENEGDGKVKLAKLSELKDMNRESSSSSWLQVGIGSTTRTDRHSHADKTKL